MDLKNVAVDESVEKKGNSIKRALDIAKKEENLSSLGLGTINLDAIKVEDKPETEQISLYLKKELLDKLKTTGGSKKIAITKLVEMVLEETFANIEIDEKMIEVYNENFKRKTYNSKKKKKQ